MLTATGAMVDGNPATGSMRVSMAELGRIKGVSKQAISKRAERLAAEGLLSIEPGPAGSKTVSLAEWDSVTGQFTDPARLVAQRTAAAVRGEHAELDERALDDQVARSLAEDGAKADPTYTQALTRKAQYDADVKFEQLKRLRGEVLPVDRVKSAIERCAEAIIREVDQLPSFAEDLAAAVAKAGTIGVRELLKVRVRELRANLERSMTELDVDDEDDGGDIAA